MNSMDESGSTPLSMAAWYDGEVIATFSLDHQGIRINGRSNFGQTPLMVAVETGNIRTAEILIERYDIEQLDVTAAEGADLLGLVITRGSNTIARYLLQKYNIQVNHGTDLQCNHKDHHGRTVLMKAAKAADHKSIHPLLHRAGVQLTHHDLMAIIALAKTAGALAEGIGNLTFKAKAVNLYVEDSCERRVLMLSAEIRLGVVLNLSLKQNGVWMNRGPDNASKILLYVVRSGLTNATAFLLRIEDIDSNFRDEVGRTALLLASEIGQQAVVEVLLKNLDVQPKCRDQLGRTALMLAARSGHPRVVVVLLENLNVQTNCKDKNGRTALMLAAQSGHLQVVAVLLRNLNVQTNCKDKNGRTALMLAAGLGYADVVTLLLEEDSVGSDCKAPQVKSAVALAALAEHKDVMSLLLEWNNGQSDSSSD